MPTVEALSAPARAPILERLRLETRPQHEAIEANPRFARLTAPDLQLLDYAAVLRRLAGFHAAHEPAIAAALAPWAVPLALARRRKLPLLRADLASLGHFQQKCSRGFVSENAQIQPFRASEPMKSGSDFIEDALGAGAGPLPLAPAPATLSAPEAWGALYVLEGATLGGRVILKALQASLGVSPGRGASFYAGYGEETGPMWRSFRLALAEACAGEPAWEAAILAGAGATFAAMDAWVAG